MSFGGETTSSIHTVIRLHHNSHCCASGHFCWANLIYIVVCRIHSWLGYWWLLSQGSLNCLLSLWKLARTEEASRSVPAWFFYILKQWYIFSNKDAQVLVDNQKGMVETCILQENIHVQWETIVSKTMSEDQMGQPTNANLQYMYIASTPGHTCAYTCITYI